MASAERQAENKKIEEENLFKSLSAEEKQAETDAFQCSRCKQVCDEYLLLLCMSLRGVSSESAGTAKRRREVPMNL
jgi:hypothetical protein